MGNWIYQGKEVTTLKEIENILGYEPYGFIYKITLSNAVDLGKDYTYYGQKTIKTDAKRIVGTKELKERGKKPFNKYKSKKGKKKGEWVYFEAGKMETWADYNSSSEIVKQLIEKETSHAKEILEFTTQKSLLNWKETKAIICSDCIENEYCLNRRVGNFHAKNVINALEKDKNKKNNGR